MDSYSYRKTIDRFKPFFLILPSVVILSFFFFWPALQNVLLSFKKISLFRLKQGGTFIGIENFTSLIKDKDVLLALFNTLFWLTFVTVLLRMVLGVCLALLANSQILKRYRLSGIVRSCLLIPWVTPEVVAVASFQWLLHPRFGIVNKILMQIGLLNEGIPFFVDINYVWFAVVAVIVWRELPFVAITVLAGLQSIPEELYESARVEGAGRWTIFFRITMPLLRPVLTISVMLITIWTFNNFLYVWLTTRGGPGNFTQVMATEMYNQAFTQYRLGYASAIGVFMTLIMVIFSFIYYVTVFKKNMEGTE